MTVRQKAVDGRGTTTTAQPHRWLVLVVLSLGVSLIVIDGTIVNVSLPKIIADLDLDLTGGQWVATLYTLVFAGLLITTGRLGDKFGRRRLFMAGVVIFVLASVLAGRAPNGAVMLIARAIQGIGGALILPSTLSTVHANFHGRDRAIAFGVWGSVISGMAAVGPLLGGWLTTDHSWRWIFYINVPVGAILLAGIIAFVPETRGSDFAPGADVVGFLLSTVGLIGVVFGLVEGRTYGWWVPIRDLNLGFTWTRSAVISAPAVAIIGGAVLLAAFIAWEQHRARIGRSAIMRLDLFRFVTFRWGNLAAMIVATGEFGLLFTLPLYLQNALGLSALGSGFVLVFLAVGALVAGGAAGPLAQRITPVNVAVLGLGIETAAVLVLAWVTGPATPGWALALVLAGYGIGLGLASAQLTSVVLRDVPTEQSGQGSATQSTARQLGFALGTAVLGTILGVMVSAYASGSLGGVTGLNPQLAGRLENGLGASAGGIIRQVADGTVPVPDPDAVAAALREAFATGTSLTLLIGAGVLAIGLVCTLRLRAVLRAGRAAELPTQR